MSVYKYKKKYLVKNIISVKILRKIASSQGGVYHGKNQYHYGLKINTTSS